MLAVVNANDEFLYVNVGKNRRFSDGESIKDTTFHHKMLEKTLCLPSRQDTKNGLDLSLWQMKPLPSMKTS